ncbi:hypothetical protein [Nocardia sp. NPDC019395]|uniref:hypothetical protein n=1 Tax=Nocardia sp. NPDC019395 TaxID=3154686 RepID=UPI0033E2A5B3
MKPTLRLCAAAALTLALSAPLGCGDKPPDVVVRHDAEPLVKYFPAIGAPVAVSWVERDNESGRAPGPSIYWIDAVVELAPDTAAELRETHVPTQPVDRPPLEGPLQSEIPAGTYLSGHDLDIALRRSEAWGGGATGYLHRDRPVLVLQASTGG